MSFEKNDDDMKSRFVKEKAARSAYSEKIRSNEGTDSGFYEDSLT